MVKCFMFIFETMKFIPLKTIYELNFLPIKVSASSIFVNTTMKYENIKKKIAKSISKFLSGPSISSVIVLYDTQCMTILSSCKCV